MSTSKAKSKSKSKAKTKVKAKAKPKAKKKVTAKSKPKKKVKAKAKPKKKVKAKAKPKKKVTAKSKPKKKVTAKSKAKKKVKTKAKPKKKVTAKTKSKTKVKAKSKSKTKTTAKPKQPKNPGLAVLSTAQKTELLEIIKKIIEVHKRKVSGLKSLDHIDRILDPYNQHYTVAPDKFDAIVDYGVEEHAKYVSDDGFIALKDDNQASVALYKLLAEIGENKTTYPDALKLIHLIHDETLKEQI